MKDGRHTYCKSCNNARSRESRARLYGGSRHYHLRRRYGIGADEVAALIAAQGGVCPVCEKDRPDHVDHDHATNAVRGILCFNCNGGLGQFKDDPALLRSAADYLESETMPRNGDRDLVEVVRARASALRGEKAP